VLALAAAEFDCLAMAKPQFEVGRERVGKGGVVRDPALRREAVAAVAACGAELGCSVMGFAASGLPGPAGNLETFVWLAEAGRPGAVGDVAAAVEGAGA
jgi:23S rRNA (cytidine1920-2'-O)/16S rRNA (cytidine1409-2'-O)-methyltransferase